MESSLDTAYNVVFGILTASPIILTALTGIIFSLLRWRRHPKVSMLALVGFLLYLLTSLAFPVAYGVIPTLLVDQGWTSTGHSMFYRVMAFSHYLMEAVALALLLAAVFNGRGVRPNTFERNLAR